MERNPSAPTNLSLWELLFILGTKTYVTKHQASASYIDIILFVKLKVYIWSLVRTIKSIKRIKRNTNKKNRKIKL